MPSPSQKQTKQHDNHTAFLQRVESTQNGGDSTLDKIQSSLVFKNIHPDSGKEALKFYLHRCWLRFLLNLASTYFKTRLWLDKGNQWLKNVGDNLWLLLAFLLACACGPKFTRKVRQILLRQRYIESSDIFKSKDASQKRQWTYACWDSWGMLLTAPWEAKRKED